MPAHDASPEVVTAIRAWAAASTLEAGRKALTKAHRKLAGPQRKSLETWAARVSFETLVEVMSLTEGTDETRVEWQGAAYHPRQLARLATWAQDQIDTAQALGIAAPLWAEAVVGSAGWYREAHQVENRNGPKGDHIAAARKFLGG